MPCIPALELTLLPQARQRCSTFSLRSHSITTAADTSHNDSSEVVRVLSRQTSAGAFTKSRLRTLGDGATLLILVLPARVVWSRNSGRLCMVVPKQGTSVHQSPAWGRVPLLRIRSSAMAMQPLNLPTPSPSPSQTRPTAEGAPTTHIPLSNALKNAAVSRWYGRTSPRPPAQQEHWICRLLLLL